MLAGSNTFLDRQKKMKGTVLRSVEWLSLASDHQVEPGGL